jgi:hypothetical protein
MASFSQRLPDWIEGQFCALSYFGGVPKGITCDNLKDGGVCKKSYIDNMTVELMLVETREGRAAACES